MGILHFRYKERRRTLRVAMTIPVVVHGQDESGEKFRAKGTTLSVSRNGALLQLQEIVVMGQMLLLVNENSSKSAECRVVSIRRDREGKTYIGVEFMAGAANIWHMTFPIPGAKPLRRSFADKVSA
jgi:c-di-GMP-binding flagellar brake protein YcgR